MMENRLFKVIMVTAMANLGAMAGMILGVYLIWQRLGLINPTELWALGDITHIPNFVFWIQYSLQLLI